MHGCHQSHRCGRGARASLKWHRGGEHLRATSADENPVCNQPQQSNHLLEEEWKCAIVYRVGRCFYKPRIGSQSTELRLMCPCRGMLLACFSIAAEKVFLSLLLSAETTGCFRWKDFPIAGR